MSDFLKQDMVRAATDHATYERQKIIKTTWGKLVDEQLLQELPVTFNDLGHKSKGCAKTEDQGCSIPLVGGGKLVLGQITTEIGRDYGPIRKLTVSLTTDNPRGERVTTPTLVIGKHDDSPRYLKPRVGSDRFDPEFVESDAKNIMANFQPKKDVDWKAVESMDSPITSRLMALWK